MHLVTDKNELVSMFLREYEDSPETLRVYTKELDRLLLWCKYICEKDILTLNRQDLLSYQEFLQAPTPEKTWCGPAVAKTLRTGAPNPKWRPFVKGLSPASIKKTIKILDSFFNYLVQLDELAGNPLAVDRRRKKRQDNSKVIDRYLELEEIKTIIRAVDNYPNLQKDDEFKKARAKYIILLLFYTGLRIAEAANHTMGNFTQRNNNWFLRVVGKGRKLREIPVPDDLLEALADFRLKVGLDTSQTQFNEQTPLIPMRNLTQSITTRRIDQILKWAFELGARIFENNQPRRASKIRDASAHWLRHSYVTYLLESGASIKVAQENAGHSDIGTTMLYTHVAQTDRHAATKKLSLNLEESKD